MICIDDDLLILYCYVYVSQTSTRLGTGLYYEMGQRSCEAKMKILKYSCETREEVAQEGREGGKDCMIYA